MFVILFLILILIFAFPGIFCDKLGVNKDFIFKYNPLQSNNDSNKSRIEGLRLELVPNFSM